MKNYIKVPLFLFAILAIFFMFGFIDFINPNKALAQTVCNPGYVQGNVPTTQIPDYSYTADGFLEFHFRLTDGRWKYNFESTKFYDQNCKLTPSGQAMFGDKKLAFWPGVNNLVLRCVEDQITGSCRFKAYDGDTGLLIGSPGFLLDNLSMFNSGYGDSMAVQIVLGNVSADNYNQGNPGTGDLISTPALPLRITPQKNPVLIIPGILSSYLNENTSNVEVWPNATKMAIPGGDNYLDELALDLLGQPNLSNPVMIPTDIFRNLKGTDYFEGLINQLKNNGYTENQNLFVFPYDWRLNIIDSVANPYTPLVTSLKDKVDQVLVQTGADKVDIVAHSMGGLLAKYYIEHYGQNKVDRFVDIATPHLGSPSAMKTLVYGDDMDLVKAGIHLLNSLEIKKISQNMTSVYQLLPSVNYFSADLPDYNYYIYDMDDYDSNEVKGRLSYGQSLDFLKNTGRNNLVMNNAVNIHNDLDNMNPADYGVKTYNIVGCGTPTIGKIFTLGKQTDADPKYDIAYISGDGTVPQRSAEGMVSMKKYYASGVTHSTMPSTNGVKELVSSLLAGTENNFDFTSNINISTATQNCPLPNGTFLGFHSPVEFHIYDSIGNHTGPNANGDLEENIPGIVYDVIDGNKFAYLPEGENYRIELKATAVGTFSSDIKEIQGGEVISTASFTNIPLISIDTKAVVDISSSTPNIILDPTGDGTAKQIFAPTTTVLGDISDDKTPPELIFSVDPEVFKLQVLGRDNISSTTLSIKNIVSPPSFSYTASDAAGNVSMFLFEVNSQSLSKLSYDVSFPDLTGSVKASLIFEKLLDKAGNLKIFTQTVKQGRNVIIYTYNVGKGSTLIRLRNGKESGRTVYPIQKNIEFISNKGIIEIK